VSLFSLVKEKAPLSFAFDLIARSLLDFDLVDLSAKIPLDPDTFLETSWIHSQKREEVSQDWKENIRHFSTAAPDDGFSVNVAKWSI